jgi:PAS domain S-box-containing protein
MRERPTPQLSPREQQLLRFAAEGLTDTAIANKLGISEATVGTYWGRVRIKLGPYSRTELVATMLRAEAAAEMETLRLQNESLAQELQGKTEGSVLQIELLEHAPDAMILVSADGKVEYANSAARDLFGYAGDQMCGLELVQLIPERYRTAHIEYRTQYVANPERRQMGKHHDTPALHKDGSEFLIRAALSSIQTDNGCVVICAIRPLQ